ncbi:murein L,D-transpeptidase catalytic domain family protein [bacterium]|nr:murein L,D-transpeptidase catalytic domain family protein [bacterium]
MWGVIVTAALLPACSAAPRYTTRATVRPRATATAQWPRREVLDLALRAYSCGRARGELTQPLLTVIDFSLPSTSKRLWVIDLDRRRVLFNEFVAHGANSGDTYATAFSNRVGSRQSSLGLFRADEPYYGRHGLSLRLSGLEPGFNDKARERAIVMHGAPYVSAATVSTFGSLGRSWGCPALPQEVNARVIDRIQGGSAVFAYYPDRAWLQSSRFLNCDTTVASR